MTVHGPAILAQAVRGQVVLKFLGELCLSLIGIAAIPMAVALYFGDLAFAARCAVVSGILAAGGLGLSRLPAAREVQANEALVVIALAFLITALLMSWPFTVTGLAPLDALFHAVSGVTTTGLATASSVEGRGPLFLFTQAWLQWYGGLVIVLLAAALILEPGAAAKQLARAEVEPGEVISGTRARARGLLVAYGTLTVLGTLFVWALGAPPFEALVHVLAGVSTGGFSTHDDSLAGLQSWSVPAAITIVALTGAVSFSFYQGLYRAKPRDWPATLRDSPEVLALFALCAIVTILLGLTAAVAHPEGWTARALELPLLAISAQTTTGFSTVDVGELDPGSKLVLIASMAIGGDAGSTAGGLKVFRLLVIVQLVRLVLLRTALPPRAVTPTSLGGARIDEREFLTTIGIISLYLAVILGSWLIFLMLGQPALESLFEVVSATTTTGLSSGLTGVDLHPLLKVVLCLDMLMGRLEIVAILILLYPRTWFGRRAQTP